MSLEIKTNTEILHNYQLLRIEMVSNITTLGKSTINLWVAQGKFPKPTHVSPTIKVWRLEDIKLWIDGNRNQEVAKAFLEE